MRVWGDRVEIVKSTDSQAPPRPARSEAQTLGPGESIFASSPNDSDATGLLNNVERPLQGHWELCL